MENKNKQLFIQSQEGEVQKVQLTAAKLNGKRIFVKDSKNPPILSSKDLAIQNLKPSLMYKQEIMTVQRPITPEEVKKKCLNCVSMEDFIKNLQNEIKRLQNLTNDLTMQLIMNGITPQQNPFNSAEKSTFQNICPLCTNQKVHQRPNTATRMRNSSEIRIRKSSAIKDRKRQILEKELEFVDTLKKEQQIQIFQATNGFQGGGKPIILNVTQSMPPLKKKVTISAQLPPLQNVSSQSTINTPHNDEEPYQ